MDVQLEKRLEKLERIVEGEDRITLWERRTFRIGMLIFAALSFLLIILNKLSDILHFVVSAWHSFTS